MREKLESSNVRYHVKWFVSPMHNVQITCSLVTGLYALCERGIAELSMSAVPSDFPSHRTMRWDITDRVGGTHRKIAVDTSDWNDRFCLRTLESVDIYFKRSYSPDGLARLAPHLREKIMPSGITFGCFVPGSRRILVKSAIMSLAGRLRNLRIYNFRESLRRFAYDLEEIRCFLGSTVWERSAADTARSRIVFQTRLWPNDDKNRIDRTEVNDERVSIVRALRKEFGYDDTVGLLDSSFARSLAPDAVLCRKVTRAEYAMQLRSSLIAVNSHGLDGSGGFKVAESLAAGCAIVSQSFKFHLTVPLVKNVNYLPFESPDECVVQCRYLLENPQVAMNMRSANLEYYRQHVRPSALTLSILERTFDSENVVTGK